MTGYATLARRALVYHLEERDATIKALQAQLAEAQETIAKLEVDAQATTKALQETVEALQASPEAPLEPKAPEQKTEPVPLQDFVAYGLALTGALVFIFAITIKLTMV